MNGCQSSCRPAFSLSRLRVRADGNVSYRVKKVSRGPVTERVMTRLGEVGSAGSHRAAAEVFHFSASSGVVAPHRSLRPPAQRDDGRAAFVLDAHNVATASLTFLWE